MSLLALLYVGAYQTRHVTRLLCPVFRDGCAAVADSAFAHRFGVPDALLGAALYAVLLVLVILPSPGRAISIAAFALGLVLLVGNGACMLAMMQLGRFCFWRTFTAGLSVSLTLALLPKIEALIPSTRGRNNQDLATMRLGAPRAPRPRSSLI